MTTLSDQIKSFIRDERANASAAPSDIDQSALMDIDKNVLDHSHDNITIVLNNLSRPDGSALIGHRHTIVQSAAYGPIEVSQSKLNPEEAVIEVIFKKKISVLMSDTRQAEIKELEALLRSSLHYSVMTRLHPRTMISVIIQEIHNGGSLLSNAVTGACCALIDCGLPMRCLVVGVTVVMLKSCTSSGDAMEDDSVLFIVQPSAEDEVKHVAKFEFVFESQNFHFISIKTRGMFDRGKFKIAQDMAREEAKKTFEAIRCTIEKRFLAKAR